MCDREGAATGQPPTMEDWELVSQILAAPPESAGVQQAAAQNTTADHFQVGLRTHTQATKPRFQKRIKGAAMFIVS